MGKLQGVAHKINQDLSEPGRIADESGWDIRRQEGDKIQPLLLCPIGKTVRHTLNRVSQIKWNLLKIEFSGLYLGKIKDFIDYILKGAGFRINGMKDILLIIIELGIQGQLCHADDPVKRCPYLMAHVGKELALSLAGFLGQLTFFHNFVL